MIKIRAKINEIEQKIIDQQNLGLVFKKIKLTNLQLDKPRKEKRFKNIYIYIYINERREPEMNTTEIQGIVRK